MMAERRRKKDWLVFIVFLLLVTSYPLGLYLNDQTRKDADRKIARSQQRADDKIKAAAIERAEQLADAARASRRNVLVRTCREFNRNHDEAISKLDELIADIPPGPRRQRAKVGRASTVALLETLAPKRHCVRRANRLIRPG